MARGNRTLRMWERKQTSCRQQMWFDDKESRRHDHGYGEFLINNSMKVVLQETRLGYCRNTPTSSEFHFSRHQPRTRPMLSRPLWQWQRRSRTALAHHRVPQTPRAKSKSTRDVQLKATKAVAVKYPVTVRELVASPIPLHYYYYNAHQHPSNQQYLFVLSLILLVFILLSCRCQRRACWP